MWFLENEEDSAKDLQAILNSLSEDEQEFFEERAAIMEYDGGLSKEDAEKEAHYPVCDIVGDINNAGGGILSGGIRQGNG